MRYNIYINKVKIGVLSMPFIFSNLRSIYNNLVNENESYKK